MYGIHENALMRFGDCSRYRIDFPDDRKVEPNRTIHGQGVPRVYCNPWDEAVAVEDENEKVVPHRTVRNSPCLVHGP
jgi:hypothetical protein